MRKRALIILVTVLLLNSTVLPQGSQPATGGAASDAKIRESVKNLSRKRVKVILRDNKKVRGYITEVGDNDFVVTSKSGSLTRINYARVSQVKDDGPGQGRNRFQGIVGVFVLVALIGALWRDPGPTP